MKKDVVIFNKVNLILPMNYVNILKRENILDECKFDVTFFKRVGLNIVEVDGNYEISGRSMTEVYNLQKVLTEDMVSLSKICQRFHGVMEIGYLVNENNINYVDLNDILLDSICA